MKPTNRSFWKFVAGGLALIAIGVGLLYLAQYLRYRQSPEYRAEQYFRDMERRYREDPYGGETPEETLQLFIDALKKGDVELASRYFVIDEQEKWGRQLVTLENEKRLQLIVDDLSKAEKSRQDETRAFFTVTNKDAVVSILLDIRRSPNGKWKILDL